MEAGKVMTSRCSLGRDGGTGAEARISEGRDTDDGSGRGKTNNWGKEGRKNGRTNQMNGGRKEGKREGKDT